MALIKCKECGEEVSNKAASCPKCGAPIKSLRKGFGCGTIVLVIIGLVILSSIFRYTERSNKGSGEKTKQEELVSQKVEIPDKAKKNFEEKVTGAVFADDSGFQGVNFGMSYKDAKRILKNKKGNFSGMTFKGGWKELYSNPYKIGDFVFLVTLKFDNKDRFYSYRIASSVEPATSFDTTVYHRGKFLTEVLTNKFGNPNECYKPQFLSVRPGAKSYLCIWNNKDLDIYVGFEVNEISYGYLAAAYVTHKEMEIEFLVYFADLMKEKARQGAKSF